MTPHETEDSLNLALRHFAVAEANLDKIERHLQRVNQFAEGVVFGSNPAYDDACRGYTELLVGLPKIDGWVPGARPVDSDSIARQRFEAEEIGEPEMLISLGNEMEEPARELVEYRYRLNRARRRFIREAILEIAERVNATIDSDRDEGTEWRNRLLSSLRQMDVLMGSAFDRPHEWGALLDQLEQTDYGDGVDLYARMWTTIRERLISGLYDDVEPLPIPIEDLGTISRNPALGNVATQLNWGSLDESGFERLLFALISSSDSYENVAWLTRTNASDRGRDLSADRVSRDQLSGVTHSRVIVQCKNWLDRSVALPDVSVLKDQMELWQSPRVDVLIIATTGRFTTDAIDFIEKHNNSDRAMKIEMWPESHLERLLAQRPGLVVEFRLR
jgi:hypothetical protein